MLAIVEDGAIVGTADVGTADVSTTDVGTADVGTADVGSSEGSFVTGTGVGSLVGLPVTGFAVGCVGFADDWPVELSITFFAVGFIDGLSIPSVKFVQTVVELSSVRGFVVGYAVEGFGGIEVGVFVGTCDGLFVTSFRVGFAVGLFEGGKVSTFVVGYAVGSFEGGRVGTFAVGYAEGGKVGTFDVGYAVGSFEGGKVGTSVVGMIVGRSVRGFEGIEDDIAVSVSHQILSRIPVKTTSAISSSVPPVPKNPLPFFKKHPFEGKSLT